jgi:hydrogenase-4 component F
MMLWTIVLLPLLLGVIALFLKKKGVVLNLLILGSVLYFLQVLMFWLFPPPGNTLVFLDFAGIFLLTLTGFLFLVVSFYTRGYLACEPVTADRDKEEGFLFRNEPVSLFVGCLFFFLAAMTLVCVSADMGLLWVGVEGTTLASAPMIFYHRHHRSLEATWKYLLICSVGIALALMGNIFLSYSGNTNIDSLYIPLLGEKAVFLDPGWLKVAFILLVVGYGTKMGIAPLHSWLPDAHSEAPSMVSALLSGALLNCAFLGIFRSQGIMIRAGLGDWSGRILQLFGIVSLLTAALFMIRQVDFKRMLAYSSVEHMGVLALGIGIGGIAGTGAMLHLVNHSLTKGLLFLTAGNILSIYQSKKINEVKGIAQRAPKTGLLWILGFFAVSGSPPFGMFFSEWIVLKGVLDVKSWEIAVLYLLSLGIIFISMARYMIPMVWGENASIRAGENPVKEPAWMWVPPLVLCGGVLLLGLYIPSSLGEFLVLTFSGWGGF